MGHWDEAESYYDMCETCYDEGLGSGKCERLCKADSDDRCAFCESGDGDCENSCVVEQEDGVEEYLEEFVYPNSNWQEEHGVVTDAWEARVQGWRNTYRDASST